ncbi:helix-turn-helix transcriptional regulator [Companilactobacillus zhachilii]|uniref:helix-turn-helix transcriptional regulator n=1 Tax=Companilactobacillus zhachilii TaxID=2304606 RepID=UPI00403450FF
MIYLHYNQKGSDLMDSNTRIMQLFFRMANGESINLSTAMKEYHISERTFKRNMTTIHRALPEKSYEFHHDLKTDNYFLNQKDILSFDETYAIMKILLGTRAFGKQEMNSIGKNLVELVDTHKQADINNLLSALKGGSYLPVNKDNNLINRIGFFREAIEKQHPISFDYRDSNPKGHSYKRNIGIPLSLYFANYYFYVIIYRENPEDEKNNGKTYVYRLDRFSNPKMHPRKQLTVPDDKRTDEASIRNKSYLMNSGSIISYEFIYRGYYPAALDQLPNSRVKKDSEGEIVKTADGGVIIYGQMFFNGAKMWVQGQGSKVTVKAPQSLITAIKDELQETLNGYEK